MSTAERVRTTVSVGHTQVDLNETSRNRERSERGVGGVSNPIYSGGDPVIGRRRDRKSAVTKRTNVLSIVLGSTVERYYQQLNPASGLFATPVGRR